MDIKIVDTITFNGEIYNVVSQGEKVYLYLGSLFMPVTLVFTREIFEEFKTQMESLFDKSEELSKILENNND